MSEPNQLLGHWTCPLGGKADVYQTKKRGRHFYTRCECCGLVQGTGASRQQKIYDEAEFIPGLTFPLPSNVKQGGQKKAVASAPKPLQPIDEDFNPNDEPLSEHESEGQPVSKRSGLGVGLGLITLAGGLGVALWMS